MVHHRQRRKVWGGNGPSLRSTEAIRSRSARRSLDTLSDLAEPYGERALPIALDVSDRKAAFSAVASAHKRFGGSTWWSTTLVTASTGWSRS